jgi:hypothetical protein
MLTTNELTQNLKDLPNTEELLKESLAPVRLELEAARKVVTELEEKITSMRRVARLARQKMETNLITEWRRWLENEYGYDLPKSILSKLYERAYDASNGSGYYDLESHFEDLCALAREAREAS